MSIFPLVCKDPNPFGREHKGVFALDYRLNPWIFIEILARAVPGNRSANSYFRRQAKIGVNLWISYRIFDTGIKARSSNTNN